MERENSAAHGLKWGLIIGLVYLILLFLRFNLGSTNAVMFGLLTVAGFIIIILLLFFCGINFRKRNGGWVDMKEAFKAMFIAVLLFEFFYALFTFIYLKYLDPQFFDKLQISTETLLIQAKQPQAEIDKVLKDMEDLSKRSKTQGAFDFLKSYLFYVGVTGLFALLFAFIIKRKPPIFPEQNSQLGNSIQ